MSSLLWHHCTRVPRNRELSQSCTFPFIPARASPRNRDNFRGASFRGRLAPRCTTGLQGWRGFRGNIENPRIRTATSFFNVILLLLDDRPVACVTVDDTLLLPIVVDGHCLIRCGTLLRVGHRRVPRHRPTRIRIPRTPLGGRNRGAQLRNRGLGRLRGRRLLPGLPRLHVPMEGSMIEPLHYAVGRTYKQTIGSCCHYPPVDKQICGVHLCGMVVG